MTATLTEITHGRPDERPHLGRLPSPPTKVVWAGRLTLVLVALLIAVARPGVWLPFVTLSFGVGLARLAGWRGHELRLIALTLSVFAAAVDYLSWRLSVLSWSGWFIGVPLLLAELHAALHSVGLHTSLWPRHPVPLRTDINPVTLPVFVFVPTVNEGPVIVQETLVGILAAKRRYQALHPAASIRVVVCNDGGVAGADCSQEVISTAWRLGVECVTRTQPGGAKAGNFENARRYVGATGDALVVIFDADQVPHPDFFVQTLAPFSDPTVGWVQTGQFYRNRANPVARWADDQQSLFYRLQCPAKADHDAAFICGTNVVIRAAALDEIGGLPTDSVTEDFAASIKLAPRWRSIYLPGVLSTGLGPIDLRSYLRQQERWARGTLTVLRDHWRDLLLPRRGGLTAQQRLQYGLATTHYLAGLRDTVFLLAPVLFLLTGISGVRGATLSQFLQHFVPYYLLALVAFWHAAWRVTSWRSIVVGFASTPALLRATWMTVVGHQGRFVVTPKQRTRVNPWRTAAPYLTAVAACVLALGFAHSSSNWLAEVWLGYLSAMLLATLALVRADAALASREQSGDRNAVGVQARARELLPIIRSERAGRLPRTDPARLSRAHAVRLGMAAAVAGLTTLIAVAGPFGLSRASSFAATAPPQGAPAHPRFGLSGATETQAAQLVRGLPAAPTFAGRAFELSDPFDAQWASAVSAAGGVPWLTVTITHRGQPGLDSSLTALRNGVDDQLLRRWAASLTRFDRPVYLTVVPQVDRDFAASSAVAAGGIPQDVAPAWEHVRHLFAAAGATNVAWVWSPADPGHDALYAPPANEIDAVAVTLYQYPGTVWVDPASSLTAAAAQHPGKPLLVEASAAGTPAAGGQPGSSLVRTRSDWVSALAQAASTRTDVAGVLYHNDGPYSDPTNPSASPWALTAPEAQVLDRMSRTQVAALIFVQPRAPASPLSGASLFPGIVDGAAVPPALLDQPRTDR